jgi:hypothetical protein
MQPNRDEILRALGLTTKLPPTSAENVGVPATSGTPIRKWVNSPTCRSSVRWNETAQSSK